MGHLMELHPDFLPQDADLDRVKAGDHAHLAKVAEAMQEIWSFHYAEMPGEDWKRADKMLTETLGKHI